MLTYIRKSKLRWYLCSGIKRRLDIAINMMSNPKILFLDEPTVGMDIKSRKSMWEMIRSINKEYETTIVLTTHYLKEADNLSDKILIMKNGKNIVFDSPTNLKKLINPNLTEVTFKNKNIAKKAFRFLKNKFPKSYLNKNTIILTKDFYTINRFLLDNKIKFIEIRQKVPSIEDIFLNYTN